MTGPMNKKSTEITTLRGTIFATAAATAMALAGPAWAASAPAGESGVSVNLAAADNASMKTAIKLNYAARASELIGKPVENRAGDVLGTVEDLILTRQDKIAYAVISVGGFLGIGNKLVAVPYDELEARIGGALVLDRSRENLEAEPEFVFSDSRSDFKEAAGAEYEEWKARVSSYAEKSKDKSEEVAKATGEQIDGAWTEVEVAWSNLQDASEEGWDNAKTAFEDAWRNFRRTWREATTDE